MGPGLGPQGKLEGLCVDSFNNCFGKFVPFFNGSYEVNPGNFAIKCILKLVKPSGY